MPIEIYKFGDPVEARSYGDGWLRGFKFIAYVPELKDHPYIVKGDLDSGGMMCPLRAHRQIRRADPEFTPEELEARATVARLMAGG